MMNRLKALMLVNECTGDDIWSIEHCQLRNVPQSWIAELADCFESGFKQDSQTIYDQQQVTNQYEGIRDVDLAVKLAKFLQLPVESLAERATSRRRLVQLIQEAAEES
jgi:hypothetical protein